MNIRLFPAIIASLLLLLFLYYYSLLYRDASVYRGVEDFENLAADVAYVGNKECAYCHREIYQSFMRTGMGRCGPAHAGAGRRPACGARGCAPWFRPPEAAQVL